ncbi:hypothetical protein BJF82_11980 [Kytococcus sp. CUA-901]|nr:hypothetical protein BJF82_11980 [Kytococcus sp. CUA-901]
MFTGAGVALAMIVASATFGFRPSDEEVAVDAYMEVCEDLIWGNERVSCLAGSRDHLVANFDDFQPEVWHGYDPTFPVASVPADELARGGPWLDGASVRSVGEVIDMQRFGPNEGLIQLRPPTDSAVDRLGDDWLESRPAEEEAHRLLASAAWPSDKPADLYVYLNVATRHFFTVEAGDLVIFDGTPVAYGLIRQVQSDRLLPGTYVRGHSVEHLNRDAGGSPP